ncbi:zinc ribbon domain-containing protein [Amphibacillus sediminis]|uniref:zinc ribbon domain-containing protein n=1 Tax=Amphibacillus sediminis TaxID=360185 RepID=UPI0008331D12|nr:zinc ribbon domain-containing protein [Amphibacillus sediminis]
MAYCPYCGAKVYHDEVFCPTCGDKLPQDIEKRIERKQFKLKHLKLPMIVVSMLLIIFVSLVWYSFDQKTRAQVYYKQAEEHLLVEDYSSARLEIEKALNARPVFPSARVIQQFAQFALDTMTAIENEASQQEQLQIILQAKLELEHYEGEVANLFSNRLYQKQTELQLDLAKQKIADEPDVEDLPAILWEIEGIQDPEAYELARVIREQISAHTANQANTFLQSNQFSKARTTVENGLYYVAHDEKLQSLLATIEKEHKAFESALEVRMEQAITAYEEETNINQNDAVTVVNTEITDNEQGHLIIKGEIKSVATVPIHAIQIHYSLLDHKKNVIKENDVYVYPDTLYPSESGQFDQTYFDEDLIDQVTEIQIDSITWLLEE